VGCYSPSRSSSAAMPMFSASRNTRPFALVSAILGKCARTVAPTFCGVLSVGRDRARLNRFPYPPGSRAGLLPLSPLRTARESFPSRSYWIPGSWHLRMVYTNAIPFHDPSQESNRAG